MHILQKQTAPYLLIFSSDKEQSAASKEKKYFLLRFGKAFVSLEKKIYAFNPTKHFNKYALITFHD